MADGPLTIDTTGGVREQEFVTGGHGLLSSRVRKQEDKLASKIVGKPKGSKPDPAASSASSSTTSSSSSSDTSGGEAQSMIDQMSKGGPIKRTGLYKLHAGEHVLNKKQAKRHKRRGSKRE